MTDTVTAQRLDAGAVYHVLARNVPPQAFEHGLYLGFGRESRLVVYRGFAEEHLILQAAHADHEEFIQVVHINEYIFHPLEQGDAGISRLLQHAFVKLQPAEFTVQVDGIKLLGFTAHDLLLPSSVLPSR